MGLQFKQQCAIVWGKWFVEFYDLSFNVLNIQFNSYLAQSIEFWKQDGC